MISAQVAMHGFESPSFATLCSIVATRDTAARREIHVLHSAGQVVAAVDTAAGRLAGPWPAVTDPSDLARGLRQRHQVDRVVVADEASVAAMMRDVEDTVTPALPQPDLLLAFQQAFRTSPGIVADPPLEPLSAWAGLRDAMIAAADGALVLAAADDTSDGWPIALLARLRDGVIAEVTDLPPAAVVRLPDLAAVAEAIGERIALALVTDVTRLTQMLHAPDAAAAIVTALTGPTELP